MRRVAAGLVLLLMLPCLSGCWYAAAAGAGVYVGYKAKEEGYGLQNPVTKKDTQQDKEEDKDQVKSE
jgi:hypothetical protein